MAKLKIADNADPTVPSKSGYINVVENLILKPAAYNAFIKNANKATRPTKLQAFAGVDENGVKCVVKHETTAGVLEAITDANCLVNVQVDKKRGGSARKSKHNMSVPETRPTSVDYLSGYAKAIHDLYEEDPVKACKFMFGMMLLTRCR